jgi:hypothetical protein
VYSPTLNRSFVDFVRSKIGGSILLRWNCRYRSRLAAVTLLAYGLTRRNPASVQASQ